MLLVTCYKGYVLTVTCYYACVLNVTLYLGCLQHFNTVHIYSNKISGSTMYYWLNDFVLIVTC